MTANQRSCPRCRAMSPSGAAVCGHCGHRFPIQAPFQAAPATPPSDLSLDTRAAAPAPDTKDCPFCAERILAAAVRCRYCQSDLTAPPGWATEEWTAQPTAPSSGIGSATATKADPRSLTLTARFRPFVGQQVIRVKGRGVRGLRHTLIDLDETTCQAKIYAEGFGFETLDLQDLDIAPLSAEKIINFNDSAAPTEPCQSDSPGAAAIHGEPDHAVLGETPEVPDRAEQRRPPTHAGAAPARPSPAAVGFVMLLVLAWVWVTPPMAALRASLSRGLAKPGPATVSQEPAEHEQPPAPFSGGQPPVVKETPPPPPPRPKPDDFKRSCQLYREARERVERSADMMDRHRNARTALERLYGRNAAVLNEVYRGYPYDEQIRAYEEMIDQGHAALECARTLSGQAAAQKLLVNYLDVAARSHVELRAALICERSNGYLAAKPLWDQQRRGIYLISRARWKALEAHFQPLCGG